MTFDTQIEKIIYDIRNGDRLHIGYAQLDEAEKEVKKFKIFEYLLLRTFDTLCEDSLTHNRKVEYLLEDVALALGKDYESIYPKLDQFLYGEIG